MAVSFSDDKLHRSSFGLGIVGSGGSVFAKNNRTNSFPDFIEMGTSNQTNCIFSFLIPSAMNIFDSGSGSLEYTFGELQLDRIDRITQMARSISLFFTIPPTL